MAEIDFDRRTHLQRAEQLLSEICVLEVNSAEEVERALEVERRVESLAQKLSLADALGMHTRDANGVPKEYRRLEERHSRLRAEVMSLRQKSKVQSHPCTNINGTSWAKTRLTAKPAKGAVAKVIDKTLVNESLQQIKRLHKVRAFALSMFLLATEHNRFYDSLRHRARFVE